MSHHHLSPSERVPLLALLALVIISASTIFLGRITDQGLQVRTSPTMAETRMVLFLDDEGGIVSVLDAETRSPIAAYNSGEGAFARTALRALAYTRRLHGIGSDAPFLIARSEDGQIILHDPSTQKSIGVSAFGDSNVEQFARLLTSSETPG